MNQNHSAVFTLTRQETKVRPGPDVLWRDRKTLLKAHQQQLKISRS